MLLLSHDLPILKPEKPDFFIDALPNPRIKDADDYMEAYKKWMEDYGWADHLQGAIIRAVVANGTELAREPIPHGIYAGRKRFLADQGIASKLRAEIEPYPLEIPIGARGPYLRLLAGLAYTQGSSEYGSSQQQKRLLETGHVPPWVEKILVSTVIEEGEHGYQMAYFLGQELGSAIGTEFGTRYGWGLAEDLLAREANHPDPAKQQPLVEFNPMVQTLPEFGHYMDKQDRDGWSQLMCSQHSASTVYAGMMRFFLRQEARHMKSGETVIEEYLRAGRIPMELHLKMEWEWDAIAYRLHGNPRGSKGAAQMYRLGMKNLIFPFDQLPRWTTMREFHLPGKDGGVMIPVNNEMSLEDLNGYSVTVLRNKLADNNRKRSALLSDAQRAEMRAYLSRITQWCAPEQAEKIISSGEMPTAALSWRPEHLAFERQDPWHTLREHWTDVFGNPIPSFDEYKEYREKVGLSAADRARITDCTSTPGWITDEIKPWGAGDPYKSGILEPRESDTVLSQFTVGKPRVNRKIFTMPDAVRKWKAGELDLPEDGKMDL